MCVLAKASKKRELVELLSTEAGKCLLKLRTTALLSIRCGVQALSDSVLLVGVCLARAVGQTQFFGSERILVS
jgi:hypothetical protein